MKSGISASSIRNLLPRSVSNKHKMNSFGRKTRFNSENVPPADPNIQPDHGPLSPPVHKQSASKISNLEEQVTGSDGPQEVVVRIRPANDHERGGDQMVRKVTEDSLTFGDRKFTFDSVLNSNSKQEDVFQLVGVPLVKSTLAGYNTSILAYGQTGSGKTYTMWGPPSAMVEGSTSSANQGIVPRIFQMLFSEIQREEGNSQVKQINYQCRCSFLEIYNEQIGDLLDPAQRNLEIKDDAKNGFYVDNLTEEYVTSYEDITQILIKAGTSFINLCRLYIMSYGAIFLKDLSTGLSSRKVGATSINSKSSRSHIIFTCIVESWCKVSSSKCFGSSKTSRISLIDLAGLDRSRLDDAGRHYAKEEKYVKKTISKLGNLVNILAERSSSRELEDVPYKSSRLTHLLRESLGGNTKLTVICAISPDDKSNGETRSTLRFGQRVKSICNEPVINEITEDHVNDLSDQIRQLKEELIRAKSNVCISVGSNYANSKERSVRESINQLRLSLNRSLILPRIDNEIEEVHIDEDDVRELRLHLDKLHSSCEENSHTSENRGCMLFSSVEECCETDLTSEHYISCPDESENEEINSEEHRLDLPHENNTPPMDDLDSFPTVSRTSISISTCRQSSVLQDPALSESPKVTNSQRKSTSFSSSHLASIGNVLESSNLSSEALRQSHKRSDQIRSSLRSSKIFPGPTESLAASLQRGLQIIDYHQRISASHRSSVDFSFEHLTLKPCQTIDKANAAVQTLAENSRSVDGPSASFLCVSCQKRVPSASNDVQGNLKMIVAVDEVGSSPGFLDEVSRDHQKDSTEAITREELEEVCKAQAAKIEQLNRLVEQHTLETGQNTITETSNALHLGYLKNDISQIDELRNEKHHPVKDENKLLRWNESEKDEPEIIKEVREELDHEYRTTSFDMNEKEALLREIESLKSKLQSYSDVSLNKSIGRLRSSSSLLSQSLSLRQSGAYAQGNSGEELEKERERWMEMESDWICLTDELRLDLESNRQRAEKVEMELRSEKKCTEELDDALKRAIVGHARMIEHYVDLQEKYNDLVGKHRAVMEGVAEVKRAAAKAGAKGHGSRFAKSLAAELSVLRVERQREKELLKKENKNLKIQLRDTAEAVHAAGELLVRLREAEEAASLAEENFTKVQEENEKVKKQMEKLRRKHKMEMITMKQYLGESRLPEAALRPLYREDSDISHNDTASLQDDDQAWRAEFGAIYQDHY
ncbi:hypothetical protein RJ640_004804 [Escallonia rubra]|uniref:Kinesin motor domain-containing protein n=1 Tax=Escallonia rubra TaxID=112253 RepID=A0AA88RCY1_9ASTE|nr:hypothetical protein RJ640_004804 [Escallonia rubra]